MRMFQRAEADHRGGRARVSAALESRSTWHLDCQLAMLGMFASIEATDPLETMGDLVSG